MLDGYGEEEEEEEESEESLQVCGSFVLLRYALSFVGSTPSSRTKEGWG
jgi:hypothetical protein